MESILEILTTPWAVRALIASSMVGIMCGTLGCFLVLRNMSMIGDALSHAILPGIFFAFIFFGYSTLGFFLGATLAGLVSAIGITWVQENVKTKNDAAIGIIFTSMFSIGVIGISYLNQSKGAHLDLTDFLFGNVLGISNEDMFLTFIILLYTVGSIVFFYRYLFITTFQPTIASAMGFSTKTMHYFFMLLLSVAVVSSLRTVGVILVVAMLITPAATALLLFDNLKRVILYSALIGMVAAVTGFLVAVMFGTTPGPAMTLTATFLYLLAAFFSPSKGLIIRFLDRRKQVNRIVNEDVLRQMIKKPSDVIAADQLSDKLGVSKRRIKRAISKLGQLKLIRVTAAGNQLTELGVKAANRLVRAHRLWETYQVNKMGLSAHEIHDEADYLEHLLSDEILEELDKDLGFPETDPHGSPIPSKTNN